MKKLPRSASEDSTVPSVVVSDYSEETNPVLAPPTLTKKHFTRRASLQPEVLYSASANKLGRAISSIAHVRKCSAEVVLRSILEEVNENGQLDTNDLLRKVQANRKISRICSDTINFDDILYDEEPDHHYVFESDVIEDTGLSKIVQFLTLGTLELEDVASVLDKSSVKNSFESVTEYLLNRLRKEWGYFFEVLFPLKQVHTMLFVGLFQIITVSQVLKGLPILFAYVSFFSMIYFTLKMFRCRNSVKSLATWKRLLTIFGRQGNVAVEGDDAVLDDSSLYNWSSLEPYANFFLSLIAFVLCFALADRNLPNVLSLGGISLFLSLLCFGALPDHFDTFTLVGLILDFLSYLPIALTKFGVLSQTSVFVREFYYWNIGSVRLNVSLPSLVFGSLIALLIVICITYCKSDIYQVVVPHTTCFFWWHLAFVLFSHSNTVAIRWSHLMLTVGIVWLILFPTAFALIAASAIFFFQFDVAITAANLIKILITLAIVFLPLIYGKFSSYSEQSEMLKKRKTLLLFVFYIFLVCFCASVMYHGNVSAGANMASNLTWTDFDRYCAGSEETFDNRLNQQMMCTDLMGVVVSWKGAVQSVKIAKTENFMEYLLGFLPHFLSSRLRCYYGVLLDPENKLFRLAGRNCSLSQHNIYTFEIETAGPWGQQMISSAKSTVLLTASDRFKRALVHLREGDVIWFTAIFDDYLLKHPPKLRLLALSCIACRNITDNNPEILASAQSVNRSFWSKMLFAFQYLFNFAFSPLLTAQ